jgi:hypothetical protein
MAPKNNSNVEQLLAETQDLVTRLLRENRALKARNLKLSSELQRVSKGWEQIKKLARQAPRASRKS